MSPTKDSLLGMLEAFFYVKKITLKSLGFDLVTFHQQIKKIPLEWIGEGSMKRSSQGEKRYTLEG